MTSDNRGYHVDVEDRAREYSRMNESEKQRLREEILQEPEFQESVEEMRERLRLMKSIVDDTKEVINKSGGNSDPSRAKGIAIDGAMMGAIFTVILGVILAAAAHAFQNLYYAIVRKFSKPG